MSASLKVDPPSRFGAAKRPHVRLIGELNDGTALDFARDLRDVPKDCEEIVVEVTTIGGDAELARFAVQEIEACRKEFGTRLVFLGKTQVYSAGVTIMSAFPKQDRFLTSDTVLLIHSRQMDENVTLSGPLRPCLPKLDALMAQIKLGIELEQEGYARLIEGSDIGIDEICERAQHNWYMRAEEAVRRGLVAGLVD